MAKAMTCALRHHGRRLREEIANGVTHGIGLVLAIVGLATLVGAAAVYGGASHVVGCAVFGTTLVILYAVSTLYHSLRSPRFKQAFRLLDHVAIFLLIAGTYTPVALVTLPGAWGWSILAGIWALAVFGIGLRLAFRRAPVGIFVGLYVLMGWVIAVAFEPLVESMATGGVLLLIAGGLAYTSGLAFFAWNRLPYNHAIWHGFVLVGSALHFCAILFYVVPLAAAD